MAPIKQSQILECIFNGKYLFGFMIYEMPVIKIKINSIKRIQVYL
jgi:hypothetical protein